MFSDAHRAKVTDALVSGELARTASRLFRECDGNQSGALELSFGEIRIFIVEVFSLLDLERPIEALIYDVYKRFDTGTKGSLNFEESLQLVVFLCNVVLGIQTPPTGMTVASNKENVSEPPSSDYMAATASYERIVRGHREKTHALRALETTLREDPEDGWVDESIEESCTWEGEQPQSFASSAPAPAGYRAEPTVDLRAQLAPSPESARHVPSPEPLILRPMSLAQKIFREEPVANGSLPRDDFMSPVSAASPPAPSNFAPATPSNYASHRAPASLALKQTDGSLRSALASSLDSSLRPVAATGFAFTPLASARPLVAAPSGLAGSFRACSSDRVQRNPVAQVLNPPTRSTSNTFPFMQRIQHSGSDRSDRSPSLVRRSDSRDIVRGRNSGSLLAPQMAGRTPSATCASGALTPRSLQLPMPVCAAPLGASPPRARPGSCTTPLMMEAVVPLAVARQPTPMRSPIINARPLPSTAVFGSMSPELGRRAVSPVPSAAYAAVPVRQTSVTAHPSVPSRAAAPNTARSWAVEFTLPLDTYPRGPFAGKVKILPRRTATDIHIAADMLNSGAIDCLEDFAVVFSASSRSHVLMYRAGKELEARTGLAMSR